jgi:predicted XRE-type DNA-binding protein
MKHSEPRLVVFGNVSEMLGKTGVEAKDFDTRCNLMATLAEHIKSSKMTQAQVAEILGVDQPRVSDLVRGKISKFSLGTLIEFLWKLDFDISIDVKAPKIASKPNTFVKSNRKGARAKLTEDELELA